jgi:hypothetical protein
VLYYVCIVGQFFFSKQTRSYIEDGVREKHRMKFCIEDPASKQKVI